MPTPTEVLGRTLADCRAASNPFDMFNSVILQRGAYTKEQRAIGRALVDPTVRTICVKAGHMVGKTYIAAGVVLGWLSMYANSGVVIVGPTLDQINQGLWADLTVARSGSPLLSRVGEIKNSPTPRLAYGPKWLAVAKPVGGASAGEGLQGFHPTGPVLVVSDETSGIESPLVFESLNSLKPRKRLLISNPLRQFGYFYDQCQKAEQDPGIRVVNI